MDEKWIFFIKLNSNTMYIQLIISFLIEMWAEFFFTESEFAWL